MKLAEFNYKLKERSIKDTGDFYIENYLESLGVKKVESFIDEPDVNDEESPLLLDRIDELVDRLHYGFTNNKNFYLQPDADVDGYASSAIFYRFFKDLYPSAKIYWEVHNEKEHGIKVKKIPVWIDIVVIPDAGSNDFNEQEELVKRNQEVLIIDHHHVDNYRKVDGCIIVNNQLSKNFKNKALSGSGMVYKVIQRYSEKYYNNDHYKTFLDLAAIGIISDMMDSKELDNNYLIYNGLRHINNPLILALIKKQSYSISNVAIPTKIDIAFYITPLINAVIRVGSFEENTKFFSMLIDYENTETELYTYRGNMTVETMYQKMAREAANTRNRQNNMKEKAMNFLDTQVQEKGLDKNAIVTVISSNKDKITLPKTMTGLVAMQFVKKYKKPVLVLRPRKDDGVWHYAGSGRSNPVEGFSSFRDELNNSGIVKYAQGHDNAFGCSVQQDKLDELNNYMNEHFGDIDFGNETIDVDYIFSSENINPNMLFQFANNTHIYGNLIPEPKFAFELIVPSYNFNVIGKKRNTLKIQYKNIDFIKFHAKEEIEEITKDDIDFYVDSNFLKFSIVGTAKINEFRGNRNLQIQIDHMKTEKMRGSDLI